MPGIGSVRLIEGFLAGEDQESLPGGHGIDASAAVEQPASGYNKVDEHVIPHVRPVGIGRRAGFFPKLTNEKIVLTVCVKGCGKLAHEDVLLMQHFDCIIQQSRAFVKGEDAVQ